MHNIMLMKLPVFIFFWLTIKFLMVQLSNKNILIKKIIVIQSESRIMDMIYWSQFIGSVWLGVETVRPLHWGVCVLVTQSCLTLCSSMDCSPPHSSVHGIFEARILEWVAFPSPGDLPDPGIEPGCPTLQADSLLSEPLWIPFTKVNLC